MSAKDMPLSQMLALAVRFSMRELRGGLSGFMIFLTCIALGDFLAIFPETTVKVPFLTSVWNAGSASASS